MCTDHVITTPTLLGNGMGTTTGTTEPPCTRTCGGIYPRTCGSGRMGCDGFGRVRVTCTGFLSMQVSRKIYTLSKRVVLNNYSKPWYILTRTYASLSSSNLPSISSTMATASTSSSNTSPVRLQEPTQRRAWVDCAERWLWVWERMSRPQLKSHSTSTEVAGKRISL